VRSVLRTDGLACRTWLGQPKVADNHDSELLQEWVRVMCSVFLGPVRGRNPPISKPKEARAETGIGARNLCSELKAVMSSVVVPT